jgi:uncharacterized protein YkwD
VSGRQWIGLAIVALAAGAGLAVPQLRDTGGGGHPAGPAHDCAGARGDPEPAPTLCLLNAERRDHGLKPLRENAALTRAARRHARDLLERDYFEHESPEGVTPQQRILRAGYRDPRITGENLAKGEREAGAPSSIVDGWMHSPGHRANILDPRFTEIGVAVQREGDLAMYVTTFGRR